jgi:hypothetical protein
MSFDSRMCEVDHDFGKETDCSIHNNPLEKFAFKR